MVTILAVEGMICPNCVRHVEHGLKAVAGVVNVTVSLEERSAVVSHSSEVGIDELLRAVEGEGYEATVVV